MESLAHITVQRDMERKLREESNINMTGREFLCDLHREFSGNCLRNSGS
jgi:hypothetical protein